MTESETPHLQPPVPAPAESRPPGTGCVTGIGILFLGVAGLFGLSALSQVLVGYLVQTGQMPPTVGTDLRMVIANGVLYFGLTFAALWLAIGLLRKRRWARAVAVAGAWLTLVGGIASVAVLPFTLDLMRDMMEAATSTAPMPNAMMGMVMVVSIVATILVYVGGPLIVLAGVGGARNREAVQRVDPRPSWTDDCPIPVLVVVVALSVTAPSVLLWPLILTQAPCFGVYVGGWLGALIAVAMAAITVAVAVAVSRRTDLAWWSAVAFVTLWATSFGRTVAKAGITPMYEHVLGTMPSPDMAAAMAEAYAKLEGPMIYGLIGGAAFALLYLLFTRGYYGKGGEAA